MPVIAGDLYMWTIYAKPHDYPDKFVARKFLIERTGPVPTNDLLISDRLETLRVLLADAGLVNLPRHLTDASQIVETWI